MALKKRARKKAGPAFKLEKNKEFILELRKDGHSTYEIAALHAKHKKRKVSPETVRKALIRWGVD